MASNMNNINNNMNNNFLPISRESSDALVDTSVMPPPPPLDYLRTTMRAPTPPRRGSGTSGISGTISGSSGGSSWTVADTYVQLHGINALLAAVQDQQPLDVLTDLLMMDSQQRQQQQLRQRQRQQRVGGASAATASDNGNKRTKDALVYACARNQPAVVRLLLEAGGGGGVSASASASASGASGADAAAQFNRELALRTAIAMDHVEVARILLEYGGGPELLSSTLSSLTSVDSGALLLVRACTGDRQHMAICRLLVEYAARAQDFHGSSRGSRGSQQRRRRRLSHVAIRLAVGQPLLTGLALELLAESSLVGPRNSRLDHLLVLACQAGNLAVVRELLGRGANIHGSGGGGGAGGGEQPLLSAVLGRHAETVEYLTLRGADVNVHAGWPLAAAVRTHDWKVVVGVLMGQPNHHTLQRAIRAAQQIGFHRARGVLTSLCISWFPTTSNNNNNNNNNNKCS